MATPRLHSKFTTIYSKLFQGQSPANQDADQFFSNLLTLDINRDFLVTEISRIPTQSFLGPLKPTVNTLFHTLLLRARSDSDLTRRGNAFETLIILTRCLLSKNLSGYEIMEIFAGVLVDSDSPGVFIHVPSKQFTKSPTATIRHQALQLALVFMCGVGQLSPGAYFLRTDLFPSLVTFIKNPSTSQYTFEAILLLAILANFHKSDAGKLNPYLQKIKECSDAEFMRKICWASGFALETAIKAYQEIHNDEPAPAFSTTLGSLFAAMRPDRALASTPVDPPKELFKDQPIEACVILLPIYEFLRANTTFSSVFLEVHPGRRNRPEPDIEHDSYTVVLHPNTCNNDLLTPVVSVRELGS
ncbi:hypothetical protein VNI00_002025 [Paramarasmius palmivorus]|uniref:Uncharacterized protein n=1 Tax=Paramarasmius palmivorus TaxID=297713 RepID=A0AAW0E062_9AGAR